MPGASARYIPLHPDSLRGPEYQQLLNDVLEALGFILPTLNSRIGQAVPRAQFLRAGQLAYADGTNWDPLKNGTAGLMRYNGSAWVGAGPRYHLELPATADGTTDNLTVFQTAFTAAKALLPAYSTQADGAAGYSEGGVDILMPEGLIYVSSTIEVPHHVNLVGKGKRATVITSDYDGQIVRNELVTGIYTSRAGIMKGFTIRGTGTSKTNQVGLDLLRWNNGRIADVQVDGCDSVGIHLREIIGTILSGVESYANGSHGIWLNEGVISWANLTANGLPSNANMLIGVVSDLNDGNNLRITNSNGNVVLGGYYQRADDDNVNTGYSVYIEGTSKSNLLDGIWAEGKHDAHIYHDCTNGALANRVINATLIPASTTNRAVIVNNGLLEIENPVGSASSYPTINSSTAPYRVVVANGGKIHYSGPSQTGAFSNGLVVEDENGYSANFHLYVQQDVKAASALRYTTARRQVYVDYNQVPEAFYRTTAAASTTWETQPILKVNNAKRGWDFGDGTNATDVNVYWGAADVLKTDDAFVSALGLSSTPATITPGSGTGLTVNNAGSVARQTHKVTVTYAALAAAALTANKVIATLPAKTRLVSIIADTTVAYTGGGVTAATLKVGKAVGGEEYILDHDVLSAAVTKGLADADLGTSIARANAIQGGDLPSWSATTAIRVRLTTVTANTNQLTAGSTTYYITTEVMP